MIEASTEVKSEIVTRYSTITKLTESTLYLIINMYREGDLITSKPDFFGNFTFE